MQLLAQAQGFPVAGEPLAVDLADTMITVVEPALDLLADDDRHAAFWALQGERLPAGWAQPSLAATRALRAAVRALLEARVKGLVPPAGAVAAVNAAALRASMSAQLVDGVVEAVWQAATGADLVLAAVAASAIEVYAHGERLRACASPRCSMLFVAIDNRRKWCTPNLCGNRERAARHYQKRKA